MCTVLGDTGVKQMAKSRNGRTTNSRSIDAPRSTRVTAVNATPRVRPILITPVSSFSPILSLEDRRQFHPDGSFRLPAARFRSSTQLVPKGVAHGRPVSKGQVRPVLYHAPPQSVGFSRPSDVAICVRRKTRRQVLFAAGVGGKRVRKGKRTYKSRFYCH
nr:MAG: hypothetical protein [Microvirus sp.]